MTASTASTRTGIGRKVTMLLLGAMIACMGAFAFSSQAKAAPVAMNLTNGQLNLGFAFKGAEIMPAPSTVQLDDPPAPATPLPDLWDARSSFSYYNGLGGGTTSSFKPAGCATPVTFGIYQLRYNTGTEEAPVVGGMIIDPDLPAPGVISEPFANSGEIYTGKTTINKTGNPPDGDEVAWAVQTAAEVNPSAPCDPNPASATIDAGVTGNNVTITSPSDVSAVTNFGEASGFRFPIMIVPNPLDGSAVPVSIAATGDVTGTYDSATGETSLSGPIEARVLVGLASNPLGEYCALPLTGLTLSTTSNSDFAGEAFTAGLAGKGALTGTYSITDDATSVGGADCGTVNSVSKGAGSIWLSSGIDKPAECEQYTTGIPPNCVPDPCPSGYSGVQPDCKKLKAKIKSLKVKGPKKSKRGKKSKYQVKIKNSGNATATQVRLKVSGRGVAVNLSAGKIKAGKTKTLNLRVKFNKTGKVKIKFTVNSKNAGKKTVKKTVRVVKPHKKHRKRK